MNLNFLQSRPIRTRVTLFALAISVLSIGAISIYVSRTLQDDMQRILGEQQLAMLSLAAGDINDEVLARLDALEFVAARIAPTMTGRAADVQKALDNEPIYQRLFNAGSFVTGLDGTAVASVPVSVGRIGVNYMERDHVAAALKEGRSTVSKPVNGKVLNAPVVSMGAPIRDAHGKVIGALIGVTDLGKPNFLDKIANGSYGKTGHYSLVAAQHRITVTSSNKSRVLAALPNPGVNPELDRNIAGYEGYRLLVNVRGEAQLSSVKQIPAAQWYLYSGLSTEEAFAPVSAAQQRMLLAAILLSLLAAGLTWWMLNRQLSPLFQTVKRLADMGESPGATQPLPVTGKDEIGDLIAAFNRLLKAVGLREDALRKSERLLNESQSIAGLGTYELDVSSGLWTSSAVLDSLFGIDERYPRSVVGWGEVIHPDDRSMMTSYFSDQVLGQRRRFNKVYRIVRCNDQAVRWVHGLGRLDFDAAGNPLMMHGTIRDITESKLAQQALKDSKGLTEAIVENAPCMIFLKEAVDLRFVVFNRACEETLGHDRKDFLGKSALDLFPPEQAADFTATDREVLSGAVPVLDIPEESVLTAKNGQRWLHTRKVLIGGNDGATKYLLGISEDITDRKQSDEALRIAATAFESQQGMVITDTQRVILRVNPAFTQITGYTAEEAVGQTPRILKSGRHDSAFYVAMTDALASRGAWAGEIWNRRKIGEVYPEWLSISVVKDSVGVPTHYVAIFSDISERFRAQAQIDTLAFYDTLTQLPNRHLLLDRLEQALLASTRHTLKSALLFVDLDNFKTLNDTLGHHQGDLLLVQVAQRLKACTRDGDTVARVGSDEFVVLLDEQSESDIEAAIKAEALGDRILGAFVADFVLDSGAYHGTPSIGIALFGGGSLESTDEPLKRAELAMFQAKAAGRNTLRFFDTGMQTAVSARAALEIDLRQAVQQRQFVLHYQPQVVGNGRITGVEALVRWPHPTRGMVSPAEFIVLAEESGLILPIGQWVLETACAQLAAWAHQPNLAHLTIAVNVSARQFKQSDFADSVLATLARTRAPPRLLKLELTESMLVDDLEAIVGKMTALKARGVSFSLDDFGTGYSSLSYLKRLPLDQLKIDQGFIRNIVTDPNDAAIAKMVVGLADSMGLAVIAEGVELQAQAAFLAHLGCHAYQGYLFSRPLPLDALEALVRGC